MRRRSTGSDSRRPRRWRLGLPRAVQPRDRLLADVAALREAHRALVEPGLLGDRRCRRGRRRSAGGRARRARTSAAASSTGDRARVDAARRARASVSSASQSTSTPDVGARSSRTGAPAISRGACACSARRAGRRRRRRRRGAAARCSDSSPRSSVRLCSSTSQPIAQRRIMVEQRLQRDALGVEQQLVAGVEHAQVAEHLALGRQERRVAALRRRSSASTSLVTWPLRNSLRARAGQRELAALGAVEQRRAPRSARGRRSQVSVVAAMSQA